MAETAPFDSNAAFEEMKKLGDYLVSRMKKYPVTGDAEQDAYYATVHFLFCKSFKTYQAFTLLCKNGFIEDAQVLARTLWELASQAEWLSRDPKTHARLFAEHSEVALYEFYCQMKDYQDAHPDEDKLVNIKEANRVDEMRKNYDAFKAKFSKNGRVSHHWWNGGLRKLAELVGRVGEYLSVYWVHSDFVHTGTTSVKDYIKLTKEGWEVNCYPKPGTDCWVPTMLASRWPCRVIAIAAEAWGIPIDPKVKDTLKP
jgi:hypothetical protein